MDCRPYECLLTAQQGLMRQLPQIEIYVRQRPTLERFKASPVTGLGRALDLHTLLVISTAAQKNEKKKKREVRRWPSVRKTANLRFAELLLYLICRSP